MGVVRTGFRGGPPARHEVTVDPGRLLNHPYFELERLTRLPQTPTPTSVATGVGCHTGVRKGGRPEGSSGLQVDVDTNILPLRTGTVVGPPVTTP